MLDAIFTALLHILFFFLNIIIFLFLSGKAEVRYLSYLLSTNSRIKDLAWKDLASWRSSRLVLAQCTAKLKM